MDRSTQFRTIAYYLVKIKKVVFSVILFLIIYCGPVVMCNDANLPGCFYADEKCPNKNVTFWLYTRDTTKSPSKINVESIPTLRMEPKREMLVLIHGYTGHRDFEPNLHIRPAILKAKDLMVLSVDYNPLAREPCYVEATYNIRTVAKCTAHFLDILIKNDVVNLGDVHVIGFSLGAQTAGLIGNYLKSGRLQRITGLDPAAPLFYFRSNEYKLDQEDAEFVDVIHTDVGERGVLSQIGHADFYPNGGLDQPGCKLQNLTSPGSCNHDRAPIYFAESISSELGFWGYDCPNWFFYILKLCRWTESKKMVLMGYHASPSTRGAYFLDTNMQPPFAKGPYPHVPEI